MCVCVCVCVCVRGGDAERSVGMIQCNTNVVYFLFLYDCMFSNTTNLAQYGILKIMHRK